MKLNAKFFSLFLVLMLACGSEKDKTPTEPEVETIDWSSKFLTGVNLAGADFGGNVPGQFNVDYTYPNAGEVDYFVGKGMNVIRLPFRWERLQQSQFAEFDTDELRRLNSIVIYITTKEAFVILDPHNYSRYYGDIIGTDNVPVTAFQDFWRRLAEIYKDNPRVIFALVNEPYNMTTELWRDNANAAILAIRRAGAHNLILVPGNAWTGAHSWTQNWYGTANSITMQTIHDSLSNYAFEVHQYLDSNSSGTSDECVSTTIGSQRLAEFTAWLKQHNKRGFLGEFAGGTSNLCLASIDNMLDYIDSNRDVWLGWTYWAAGPWWGNSPSIIEPVNGNDKPQMAILLQHLGE